jgi:hypothetical protein
MYEADTKIVLSVTDKAFFKFLAAILLVQRGKKLEFNYLHWCNSSAILFM